MTGPSSECLGFDSVWHLERSRPSTLFQYFDPRQPFQRQVHAAMTRFTAVQHMCAEGGVPLELVDLRNALAFHLVKLSRWWMVDFCPRMAVNVRTALFVTYVKAHVARDMADDALFDLLTRQRDMRPNDPSHILVLRHEERAEIGARVMYGIDGRRGFRFAVGSPGQGPVWNGHAYPDFTSAWLAAKRVMSLMAGDDAGLQAWQKAACEFRWTQPWRRRAMIDAPDKPLIDRYAEACVQSSACETAFGRGVFDAVLGQIAFGIAREAFERRISLAAVAAEGTFPDMPTTIADMINRHARAHVADGIDPCVRPDFDALLDCVPVSPI